jgi:hypothetical protein
MKAKTKMERTIQTPQNKTNKLNIEQGRKICHRAELIRTREYYLFTYLKKDICRGRNVLQFVQNKVSHGKMIKLGLEKKQSCATLYIIGKDPHLKSWVSTSLIPMEA